MPGVAKVDVDANTKIATITMTDSKTKLDEAAVKKAFANSKYGSKSFECLTSSDAPAYKVALKVGKGRANWVNAAEQSFGKIKGVKSVDVCTKSNTVTLTMADASTKLTKATVADTVDEILASTPNVLPGLSATFELCERQCDAGSSAAVRRNDRAFLERCRRP